MQTILQSRDILVDIDDAICRNLYTLTFAELLVEPILTDAERIVASTRTWYKHEVLHHHGTHNTVLVYNTHGNRMQTILQSRDILVDIDDAICRNLYTLTFAELLVEPILTDAERIVASTRTWYKHEVLHHCRTVLPIAVGHTECNAVEPRFQCRDVDRRTPCVARHRFCLMTVKLLVKPVLKICDGRRCLRHCRQPTEQCQQGQS